jgi:hypothetical protein
MRKRSIVETLWCACLGLVAAAGCSAASLQGDDHGGACRSPAGCVGDDAGTTGASGWDPADESSDGSAGAPTGGDEATSSEPPQGPQLPCDVAAALSRACGECHGDTPAYGAPMSLVDFDDLHVPAPTDPTRAVFDLVGERITADTKMMPPDDDITDAERAALLSWIEAGAPADPDAQCGDLPPPDDGPDVGPEALPCETNFEVRAHAPGGQGGFQVPAQGADDLYQCFAFKAPFTEPRQAVAWAPIIDDERVVHHWILYRTPSPQEDGGVFPCDVSLQVSAEFVAGWAPGGGNVLMPEGVGLELGDPNDWYVLQVHYHNTAHHQDAVDASGVAFCMPDEPRPQTAGVLTLGTTSLNIPAGAVAHEETGNCGGLLTLFWPGDLHIIGSSPHMHELGRGFHTELVRAGGVTEVVTDVPVFNFESQGMYFNTPEIVVHPGESLRTTCVFDNPGAEMVHFGEGTADEMCFNFVLAYPIQQLNNRNCGIVF